MREKVHADSNFLSELLKYSVYKANKLTINDNSTEK